MGLFDSVKGSNNPSEGMRPSPVREFLGQELYAIDCRGANLYVHDKAVVIDKTGGGLWNLGDNNFRYYTRTKMYHRDSKVKEYAERRAKGKCELCGKDAPFKDSNGYPYLECHHIVWLSKHGEDTIENTVALCPDCHRRIHILQLKEDVEKLQKLEKYIKKDFGEEEK